jgi:hypothetical protein
VRHGSFIAVSAVVLACGQRIDRQNPSLIIEIFAF